MEHLSFGGGGGGGGGAEYVKASVHTYVYMSIAASHVDHEVCN